MISSNKALHLVATIMVFATLPIGSLSGYNFVWWAERAHCNEHLLHNQTIQTP